MPSVIASDDSSEVRPKRALFLLRYSSLAASTRVRLLQYRPYLEANGWTVDAHSFWDDAFLTRLYSSGKRSAWHYGVALSKRIAYLLAHDPRRYDAVVAHQDVFPWLPFFLEHPFYRGTSHFVLDLDDAVYVSYQQYPWLRDKYAAMFRSVSEINVGNETLAAYAREFNDRINIIPTVVDTDRYHVRSSYADSAIPVVGWIGTPVTSRFLLPYADILRQVAQQHPFRLRCVGVQPDFVLPGVDMERVPWSEQSESAVIQSFDAGIMPLAHEDFAKGKCGYKLVQYMACAVPALGTAVGANSQIINDNVNGLLAQDQEEFGKKLLRLLREPVLRARLGREGHRTIQSRFSLRSQQPKFLASLERAAATRTAGVTRRSFATTV